MSSYGSPQKYPRPENQCRESEGGAQSVCVGGGRHMRIREEGERGSRRRIRMGDSDGWRVEAHRSRVKDPRWP